MNYFKSLTKEEKIKLKEEFLSKKEESTIYHKINKIFILSIVGIVIAVLASVFDILYTTGVINYVLDGLLFVFSIIFLIKTISMKNNELNKYALDQKQSKTKK